jgi:hypothetical protein
VCRVSHHQRLVRRHAQLLEDRQHHAGVGFAGRLGDRLAGGEIAPQPGGLEIGIEPDAALGRRHRKQEALALQLVDGVHHTLEQERLGVVAAEPVLLVGAHDALEQLFIAARAEGLDRLAQT